MKRYRSSWSAASLKHQMAVIYVERPTCVNERNSKTRGRTKVGALVTDNVRDCGRDPNAEIDAIDYQKSEKLCKE